MWNLRCWRIDNELVLPGFGIVLAQITHQLGTEAWASAAAQWPIENDSLEIGAILDQVPNIVEGRFQQCKATVVIATTEIVASVAFVRYQAGWREEIGKFIFTNIVCIKSISFGYRCSDKNFKYLRLTDCWLFHVHHYSAGMDFAGPAAREHRIVQIQIWIVWLELVQDAVIDVVLQAEMAPAHLADLDASMPNIDLNYFVLDQRNIDN